jgi:5-methylthioadenosine/S-adenosylhomocysteine deaminase
VAGDAFRLRADAVVTVDDDGSLFRPGTIDVVGDRITWVGPSAEAPASSAEEVAIGGLVLPGLVNTHAHTPMTLLRSAGDGLPLDRWLAEAIWPKEALLTDDDVYWGMLLGADELLRCGVTTTCEMYLHNRAVVAAVAEAGIRCVLTPGIFDLPGAGPEGAWPAFLDEAGRLSAELHDPGGLLEVGLGPHSAYALPYEGLVATGRLAAELGALVQVHVAETAAEVALVAETHGCSAPALLERAGILDGRVLAAHSVWLDEADLDLYQRHDVAVAHCPGSNGKLGSGIAPVAELRARGLRVGLGTDGPASNDDLDLWEELRLAPLLARAVAGDPGALSTADALHLATRGGAEALGLSTGVLAPGRPADLVRLELDDSRFVPGDAELLAHLVWSASSRLVTDVWVAGRRVVADGVCRTVDGPEARRQVRTRARRLAAAP